MRVSITERIERDFTYHPPKDGQREIYESIRAIPSNYSH
jgi:hypothetical protein